MGSPQAAHLGAKTLEEQGEIEGELQTDTKRGAWMLSALR